MYLLASNLEFSLEANTMHAAAGIFFPVYFMTDHQQQAADKWKCFISWDFKRWGKITVPVSTITLYLRSQFAPSIDTTDCHLSHLK